jgi:hypothetical protein
LASSRWFVISGGLVGSTGALNGEHELRPIYQATKEFEKIAGYLPARKARDELLAKLRLA